MKDRAARGAREGKWRARQEAKKLQAMVSIAQPINSHFLPYQYQYSSYQLLQMILNGQVENEECGVWKTRSVENVECRKCGARITYYSIIFFDCVMSVITGTRIITTAFSPFGLGHQTSIEGEKEAFEHFLPVFPQSSFSALRTPHSALLVFHLTEQNQNKKLKIARSG